MALVAIEQYFPKVRASSMMAWLPTGRRLTLTPREANGVRREGVIQISTEAKPECR
jgi:hypothetical protein